MASSSGAPARRRTAPRWRRLALTRVALAFALACVVALALGTRARASTVSKDGNTKTLRMRTADARAVERDTYLYVAVQTPREAHHVVTFEPRAESQTVHHMLLFGCRDEAAPGLDKVVGGMFTSGTSVQTCSDGTSQALLYGWGKNAPPTHMPDDVGFRVGGGAFGALVLEVHYLEKQKSDAVGESGLDVVIAPGTPKKSASVLAWASFFSLPPKKESVEVRATCAYESSRELRAIGFRVHTHERGTNVWLDRLVGGDPTKAVRILERDPQLPQEFERLSEKGMELTVSAGDTLRVTCSFNTMNETEAVEAGFGASHEMCNMYIMVYSDEPQYMSCLGDNDDSMGSFEIEVGDESERVEDMSKLSMHVVRPGGTFDASWPQIGGIGGIQASSDGVHVWMTNRGSNIWEGGADLSSAKTIGDDAIVRLNLYSGKVDKSFGANAHLMPHGVRVAPDGTIWVTDVALHQVFQYSGETGEVLRSFGHKGEKLAGGDGFCAPADVLVLEDGSFIVADGYGECANRVARFNAEGAYEGDFDLKEIIPDVSVAHQLAYSPVREEIALADRENSRVILFDYHGSPTRTISLSEYGFVYGLTWMGSALEGLKGYYALCWSRDSQTPKATLVRIFWLDEDTSDPEKYAWDLTQIADADFSVPHVLAAQSSKNGGTAAWGPGLTFHVGSTTKTLGANYVRLWLGARPPGALVPPSPLGRPAAASLTPSRASPPPSSALTTIGAVIIAVLTVTTLARAHRARLAASAPPPRDAPLERVVLVDAVDADPDPGVPIDRPHPTPRVKLAKD